MFLSLYSSSSIHGRQIMLSFPFAMVPLHDFAMSEPLRRPRPSWIGNHNNFALHSLLGAFDGMIDTAIILLGVFDDSFFSFLTVLHDGKLYLIDTASLFVP